MNGWTLFYNPMTLDFYRLLWLLLPLCAFVAITYKTIRVENLRRLPLEILLLCVYLVLGLSGLGVGLYIVQRLWM